MPLVYYVPEYERDAEQIPLDAERLLRLLGVTGKLSGFRYAVYMVEQVRDQPDNVLLITKRLYKQTADHFNTTPSCVERNLRTLIQSCWNQLDHDFLNVIAGTQLRQPPTNSQFIDMMDRESEAVFRMRIDARNGANADDLCRWLQGYSPVFRS